ncbi:MULTISPECIES: TetR/AcrR family transcriptional regulator [Pseudonocardia]|uniref:HTH-type transcriptional repressor KstR2 n=2 Tax=Pseudonocardia TaxID=1847 RepID=A0A1Y2MJQ5_PSEAH|nr:MULTISPECIES: TetR/AcrR family transcriptional regulator [Pseudonocardia]OSY34897.1 HTH-type transcriptional repressor KstR2 [Pseudonocardia autotrophica]TDN75419.1 TetR family transcriptional regulator [Pseudonocardia autotrophica]BBF99377.1 TetR family transcriptional regulator [Pseudonocardia autotrophica]GEC29350.1 TetR family transcriptional regulator [Pseudonocardia saturnea]
MPRKAPERSYDPVETRRVLLDAALNLFAEKGFSRASMQDVVQRAGVTKGAFYHHFATKEDVLHIIHDEFIDRALESQEAALAGYDSPTEQLAHMAYSTTRICIEYQKHVMVFFRELHVLDGEVRSAILDKRRRSTAIFKDVVRRGVAGGDFDEGIDPDVAALGMLGMWIWPYQWYGEGGSRTPDEIARQLASMSLQSVGAKVTAAAVL